MKSRISIDPGYDKTAYAVWEEKRWPHGAPPIEVGQISPDSDTVYGMKEVTEELWNRLYRLHPEVVYIEMPGLFGGSAKSQASAARGDLFKLTFLVGGIAHQFPCAKIELVGVTEWKGQLPKEVCQKRIEKILGPGWTDKEKISHHEYDAIGIGLFKQGRF